MNRPVLLRTTQQRNGINMSTPMYDLPEHLPIGINKDGQGPVAEDDPEFDRIICWCGDAGCLLFKEA